MVIIIIIIILFVEISGEVPRGAERTLRLPSLAAPSSANSRRAARVIRERGSISMIITIIVIMIIIKMIMIITITL